MKYYMICKRIYQFLISLFSHHHKNLMSRNLKSGKIRQV